MNDPLFSFTSGTRRSLLVAGATLLGMNNEPALAAPTSFFNKRKGLYVVNTRKDIADSVRTEQVDTPVPNLSSEYALLKVLPVKNPIFRTLEHNIESISALRFGVTDEGTKNSTWVRAQKSIQTAIEVIKNKRSQLEPVFNPEDTTAVAILKGERGEILIEQLRDALIQLYNSTTRFNMTCTFAKQKEALVTLGFLGELLVKEFPYKIPSSGKFSFLPRLIGRAQVTFRIKRAGGILGNITIVADGYTAPITAGHFVDLCVRNFYTGLPIKAMNKRFGPLSDQIATSINVLGSFNEGFYDPLTAKLRRIPLEIIRLEKGSGNPKLSYSTLGSPDVLLVCNSCLQDVSEDDASFTSTMNSKPLLTFDTPGLVALNHPDKNLNGGSSEFFSLTDDFPEDRKRALDGEYAPFGYIINGYDLFCELEPDDVIDATYVDEYGQLNLVKIRESSFKEAAQGSEAAE